MVFVHLKYYMKWDPMSLTRNGYTLELTASCICMFCSFPPSSQIMLTLAFLTVRDGEDMVSAFSLPILWKRSYSVASFGLLRSTLSPHETCFMPSDKPSWPPLRTFCLRTDPGYKGSSRHMFVGKEEQLWGVVVGKTQCSKPQPTTKSKD